MANLVSITSERHAQAIKERDGFLKAHPQLLLLQRKIDARLGHAKTEHNRLVLIHEMMMDSVKALTESLRVMIRSLAEFNRRARALDANVKAIRVNCMRMQTRFSTPAGRADTECFSN